MSSTICLRELITIRSDRKIIKSMASRLRYLYNIIVRNIISPQDIAIFILFSTTEILLFKTDILIELQISA